MKRQMKRNKELEVLNDQALEQEYDILIQEIDQLKARFWTKDFKVEDFQIIKKEISFNFIKAASNLRANVFDIKISSLDRLKTLLEVKNISYRTSTATIAGAVWMELIKITQGIEDTKNFRNTFLNLESSHFVYSQPKRADPTRDVEMDPIMFEPVKAIPPNFTVWDFIEIRESMTIRQLFEKLKNDYKVKTLILSYSSLALYNEYIPGNKHSNRLDMKIEHLITQLKGPMVNTAVQLEVWAETMHDQTYVSMPKIKYVFG
jgi:hypothetical protein